MKHINNFIILILSHPKNKKNKKLKVHFSPLDYYTYIKNIHIKLQELKIFHFATSPLLACRPYVWHSWSKFLLMFQMLPLF